MTYSLETFQANFGANPRLVQRLAAAFLKEGPRQADLLEQALQNGEARAAGSAAHTMKGAVSNYGYPALVAYLQEVESGAGRGELPAADEVMARVRPMVDEMLRLLTPLAQA